MISDTGEKESWDNQEMMLDIILDNTATGYWEWNVPENTYKFHPSFYRLYGYKDGDNEVAANLQQMIHPDERSLVYDAFSKHVESKGAHPYDIQVHYRHKNGKYLLIRVRARVIDWLEDGRPKKMVGTHTNISQSTNDTLGVQDQEKKLKLIARSINAGIWDWNISKGISWWSDRLYELLDYFKNEIKPDYETFMDLLHKDDSDVFQEELQQYFRNRDNLHIEIRLRNREGAYQWFELYGCAEWDDANNAEYLVCSLIDIEERKKAEAELRYYDTLMREAGKMAKAGAWEVDLKTMKPVLSDELFNILDLPAGYEFSMEEGANFYHPDYRDVVRQQMRDAMENGQAWDVECKFITAKKREKWVRIKGIPIMDDNGHCISVRGVLQDVDDLKTKELELQKSLDILAYQNKRLQNFAHIVSHNLRSHTGNIKMLLHFYEKADEEETRGEALQNIYRVSDQLDSTIHHLNEIVEEKVDFDKDVQELSFEQVLKQTLEVLEGSIRDQHAKINYDFSACPGVRFVTPYLESIFLNLITNAIKYRHKDRDPEINIRSYSDPDDKDVVLEISDNGSGIDLNRHGRKMFGMYKTFHKNVDARGLGLFITKNQIESAGGSIDVESTPGVGTKFIISFRKQE